MEHKIYQAFDRYLNGNLKQIIISNSSDVKHISKIKLRPVLLKGTLKYQTSSYLGTKVFHENFTKEELLQKIEDWFMGLFRQIEIKSTTEQTTILIGKKGTVTIKTKAIKEEIGDGSIEEGNLVLGNGELASHNRTKQYLLKEGTAVPFLVDLGIMSTEGKIIRTKYDKYKQMNRYLEFIEDILPNFPEEVELSIVDFGCGKSYLTFAMYYYLAELLGRKVRITGLDLKDDVIATCNDLKDRYGYENLQFLKGDIATYSLEQSVDMVVTLHACDTATDYALYKAITWGAKVILSVPCCQHELNKQVACEELKSFFQYGLIKERMAALMTDAIRGNLLEALGYKVSLLEFIDMEHTPKNILIRAILKEKPPTEAEKEKALKEISENLRFLNANPTLHQLIGNDRNKRGIIDG